ncbi:ATP-binding protein [Ideonella sp. BN130291]|uniref:ATP-binding protein n=1 Tax=Ideonella sp. BN130291 TaxID=3112940 RepID=UPI002E269638|nr:ATP-binding protein [Ideonella sp. BN130291]
MPTRSPLSLRLIAVVTALFWLAAKLGFVFSDNGHLTPVWPPAAVACGAALLYGPRVLVGAALYVLYDFICYNWGRPALYAKGLIEPAAMLLAAQGVCLVARRVRFDSRLDSVRSVLLMVGLSLLYALINGGVDTLGYCGWAQSNRCLTAGWAGYWGQAAVGDVFGCLICLPAVLSWLRALDRPLRDGWRAWWPLQGARVSALRGEPAWFIAVGLASALVAWWVTRRVQVPVHVVGYLALPMLVWAALKFRAFFVHSAILATGLVTISLQLTASASAPADFVTHVASLFLFLLSVSALTLLVSVAVQRQNELANALAFRAQQERVELMLDNASDAVISFDAQGRLSYWNSAAERMFGLRSGDALGRPVLGFLPIPGLGEGDFDLATVREQQPELFSGQVLALESRDGAGEPLPVEVALTAYRSGEQWNATAFVRDASARLRQQEALREAKERAEEATRVKSLFLATMSHELRTPLSGVIGMLQLALRGELSGPARSKVTLALSNAESLLAIINDILDYSKIEAGKMSFEQVDFDVHETVQSLAALLDLNAQEKGLSLLCRVAPEVPRWLRTDPVRLRQILFNLLGNALKFTERGFVELRVGWQPPEGDEPARLLVEVEDTGIGISQEAQSRLFRSFEQAEVRISRHYGGTGLGLTISRSLIEGQGGTIGVRSKEGEGTCFWFSLPVEQGEPVTPVAEQPSGPFDCRLHLLCAEDGPTNQMIVRAFLEEMGHQVEFVENGREAVLRCAEQQFDVVLMDGRMPVMDGLDATRAIRAGGLDNRWVLDPDVWIIALTANATLQDRAQCLAAGMNDFLAKPVNERQLSDALHRAVQALRQRGRLLQPPGPQAAAATASLDALLALEPVGEAATLAAPVPAAPPSETTRELPLKQRLRETFRTEGRRMLDELKQALAAADWPEAARLAHGIKGSALYVDATVLAEAAGWLETACDHPPPDAPEQEWAVLEQLFDNWAGEP